VDWFVEDSVSEKRTASIFRAKVITSANISALKMKTARFSETLASTNQFTRRFIPKEHNQKVHRRENLNLTWELKSANFSV
jgi:hypothetical protein